MTTPAKLTTRAEHDRKVAEDVLRVIHGLMPLSRAVVPLGSPQAAAWTDRVRTLLGEFDLAVIRRHDIELTLAVHLRMLRGLTMRFKDQWPTASVEMRVWLEVELHRAHAQLTDQLQSKGVLP